MTNASPEETERDLELIFDNNLTLIYHVDSLVKLAKNLSASLLGVLSISKILIIMMKFGS